MSSAFYRHQEMVLSLTIVHGQLVIFACDFSQAPLNPLEDKIAIFRTDARSSINFHGPMLTDRALSCELLHSDRPSLLGQSV